MSGITKEGVGPLRFLTLTSAPDSPGDLANSWRTLCRRLKRHGVLRSYIKVSEVTKSGLKHLHVLVRGSFIEQVYLSKAWERIHGAPVVGITKAYGRGGAARYMAKYMAKEGERYSWDWGWVHLGFGKAWSWFKGAGRWPGRSSFSDVLEGWNEHVHRIRELEVFWGVDPGRVFVVVDPSCICYHAGGTDGIRATYRELIPNYRSRD